ncbi:hypothetical protein ABGB16_01690 [Micromonospora sp. B11E3]|uniref:hypothetical protein n=1 Tax=Micromonospora sp. B11E3 TaxID=3153562 RepID=UPI00325ECA36
MHPSPEPADRLLALGHQLIEIHTWLREELTRLREGLGPESGADPPDGRLRSLRAHCLVFCSALTRHHGGEDAGAFRVLAERTPELRPPGDRPVGAARPRRAAFLRGGAVLPGGRLTSR